MNKRIFIPILLLFILAPLTHLFAQYERQLTLEESISIAKDNSPLARAAKYALVASKWRYKSFKADLLPSLDANGDVPNYSFGQRTIVTENGTQFIDLHQSEIGRAHV